MIHLITTYVQHPKCENEISIMHLVNIQTNCKVTINQKEMINCVQIYLELNYISEICTVNGTAFVPGILEEDNCQLNYQTTLAKPRQENPGNHSWILWRKILIMLTPITKTTIYKLQQKLWKWMNTHSECGKWLSYQDRKSYTKYRMESK